LRKNEGFENNHTLHDLFNDPKFGGGTAGVSCNSCHLDGRGLEKAADKKDL
jgi:hypothetical protein